VCSLCTRLQLPLLLLLLRTKRDVEAELLLTSAQTAAEQPPLLLSSTVVATLHAESCRLLSTLQLQQRTSGLEVQLMRQLCYHCFTAAAAAVVALARAAP
jgi:hypothetical protein